MIISVIFIFIGCVGEEIGWRGFLLPSLNRRFSLIVSSLLLGITWGVWHLNFDDGVIGFIVYILSTIVLTVIMSWIQVKANSNLIPIVLFHFFVNLFARLILFDRMGLSAFLIMTVLLGIVAMVLFMTDKATFTGIDQLQQGENND